MINLPISKADLESCEKSFGHESEILKTIQECGELIVALTRSLEGREHNAVEEIADVLIMASQMMLLFGDDAVKAMIESKMNRVMSRIGVEK